jgi:Arc/MetJ-type ribon-helix-helix transcriptional regulator
MPNKKYSSVSLPLPLINKIKKNIKNTGFKSISDYVTFILREIFAESKGKPFSVKDREQVKKRLKILGYF